MFIQPWVKTQNVCAQVCPDNKTEQNSLRNVAQLWVCPSEWALLGILAYLVFNPTLWFYCQT